MKNQDKPIIHTKRWKKNQSCVSNPEYKKFREAAKKKQSGGVEFKVGQASGLTCDALMKHNTQMEEKLMDLSDIDDAVSIGRHSIATSSGSNCTNATFRKVIHNFSLSNVAAHKEVLSVLETVAEMIKKKSEDDSDMKYLLTLLHLLKSEKVTETGHTSAILYLLSLCVKRVPQLILRKTFIEASEIILEALNKNVESDSVSLVKSALTILAALLRSLDQPSWTLGRTREIYFSILCLTDCEKHKVRKIAQHAIRAVLNGSCFMTRDTAPLHHPAIQDTFEFCKKKLEEKGNDKRYLYVINLMGEILPLFPRSCLEKSCEILINRISSADAITSKDCLNALRNMFALRPSQDVLTLNCNIWIISELKERKPTVQPDMMGVWLIAIGKAHSNLSRLDASSFLNKLPDFFKTCFEIMSHQESCSREASEALMVCINDCTAGVVSCASDMSKLDDSPIHRLVDEIKNTYSMFFMGVMNTILKITDIFIKFFGKSCSRVLKKLLVPLNALNCDAGFQYKSDVFRVFATSIKTMGPEVFLEMLPLRIAGVNDDMEFPMGWILPLMRVNVQETNLKFFLDYFLPLLSKISKNMPKYATDAIRKTYEVIVDQIWSLFPGFCTKPNDLVESFPKMAELLAKLLAEQKNDREIEINENSRMDILASLRKLVNSSISNVDQANVMGRYARNYLALFCKMYTGFLIVDGKKKTILSQAHNKAILETFKTYLKVSPVDVTQFHISECIRKLESIQSGFEKHLMIELIIVLIPYMDVNTLVKVFEEAKKYVKNEENDKNKNKDQDELSQKKGYKLYHAICSEQPDFVLKDINREIDFLVKMFKTSDIKSKVYRIKCITHLVKLSPNLDIDFLNTIVPEAIMCMALPGAKAKGVALNLLVELSNASVRWNGDLPADVSFKNFMVMLIAGLASSPDNVIKCTILAISEVLRVNTYMVSGEILQIVIDNLITLMKSKTQEILRASLALMKVLVSKYLDKISLFIKPLVTSLIEMNETAKIHLRFTTREIYVKLVKKLGHQVLLEMMPQSSHKIITHIRKELERAKKKGDKSGNESESLSGKTKVITNDIENIFIDSDDDNDSDNDEMKSTVTRKSKKASDNMVFVENEEATDLLHPSAHRSVSVKKEKKKKEKEYFRVGDDGKLIIGDFGDDEKFKKKIRDDDDDDYDHKSRHTAAGKSQKNRKRKRTEDENDESDDDGDDDRKTNFSYKSGGTGIHRKNPSKQPVAKGQMNGSAERKAKKHKGGENKPKMQPFSYVPLDKRTLNKRFRQK